jgi:hypothetical protein
MINREKIKVYKKYDGDIDYWARNGSKKEKLIISDKDWYVIDGLIQDFFLIKGGLTSSSFNDNFKNKLKEVCDSEDTIKTLETMSTF